MPDDIHESALVRSLIDGQADFPSLLETARILSSLDTRFIVDVREAASVRGHAGEGVARNDLLERALLHSALDVRMDVRRDIVEKARIRSSSEGAETCFEDAAEQAVVHGSLGLIHLASDFSEQGELNDALSTRTDARSNVHESAQIHGQIGTSERLDAYENAGLRSGWSVRLRALQEFHESAQVRSWLDALGDDVFDLFEDARMGSALDAREDRIASFIESARIISRLESSGRSMAYAAHPAIFGMSQYDNFPFESLAGVYAAGSSGLFTQDNSEVEASFSTGRVTMGASVLKRIGAMYAIGTHDRPMQITVSGDVRGRLESHAYTQQTRDALSLRNQKAVFGKGFRSSYFRFEISGSAMFDISSLEVMAEKSERRV